MVYFVALLRNAGPMTACGRFTRILKRGVFKIGNLISLRANNFSARRDLGAYNCLFYVELELCIFPMAASPHTFFLNCLYFNISVKDGGGSLIPTYFIYSAEWTGMNIIYWCVVVYKQRITYESNILIKYLILPISNYFDGTAQLFLISHITYITCL